MENNANKQHWNINVSMSHILYGWNIYGPYLDNGGQTTSFSLSI